METIAIVHSGSSTDYKLIEELKKCFNKDFKYYLEYIVYEEHQQKDVLLQRTLKKYAQDSLSLIALLSQSFFDLVWPTPYKSPVIKLLTNYPDKRCLHIHCVDKIVVKRHSTDLVAKSPNFRTLKVKDLATLTEFEALRVIEKKLFDPVFDLPLLSNNYSLSVDPLPSDIFNIISPKVFDQQTDEITHAKAKLVSFPEVIHTIPSGGQQKLKNGQTSNTNAESTKTKRRGPTKPGTNPNAHYLAAAACMLFDDVERDNIHDEGNATKSKKAKKKKKKAAGSEASSASNSLEENLNKTIRDVRFQIKDGIAMRLDGRNGSNWKDVARRFDFTAADISNMQRIRSSPTQALFDMLHIRMPEVTIRDFAEHCRNLQCNDVVKYIEDSCKC